MNRLKYTAVWLAISALAGALAHYLFGVRFWAATLVATFALVANGFIASWEDRGKFND